MFLFLITLAFIVRIVLMPISAHADLFSLYMLPRLLIDKQIINYYDYADRYVPKRHNLSYYPPLTYYSFALFQFSFQPLSESFAPWMDRFLELLTGDMLVGQAYEQLKLAANTSLTRDLFLAKTPYLIFDMATLFIILKFIKKRLLDKRAIYLWLFNPVLLYSVYIFGQFEIITSFFVFLGFFLMRKNLLLGLLALGVAAAYKNYAFIFILIAILIYGRNLLDKITFLIVAVSPYVIFLLPIIITSPNLAINALFPQVFLSTEEVLKGWPLFSSIIKYLIIFASLLFILTLAAILKLKDKWGQTIGLSLVLLTLILTFWPRTLFHYLLWTTPLVIPWFKNVRIAAVILIVQALSFGSYNLLASHVQLGLFAPLNLEFFPSLPAFNEIINKFIPYRVFSTFGVFTFLLFNLYLASSILLDLIFKKRVSLQDQR